MLVRKIVHIEEEKCDGCGQCVPSCAEGAIRIVGGKARVVSDVYCDGLGACLGQCPRDAISLVEREASPFDEGAVHAHVAAMRENTPPTVAGSECPGAAVKNLRLNILADGPAAHLASGHAPPASGGSSRLANWPLQLHLVPPDAPFLRDADVLLVADCVPVAHPDFHRRFLNGRPVLMGCPKLDNATAYVQKLAQIIRASSLRSIRVLHMEVPCCTGLLRIAEAAVALAGGSVPIHEVTVAIDGRELSQVARGLDLSTRIKTIRGPESVAARRGSSPSRRAVSSDFSAAIHRGDKSPHGSENGTGSDQDDRCLSHFRSREVYQSDMRVKVSPTGL